MLSINVVVPPWNYWNNPLKIQPLWELYYATLFQTKFPTAKVTITDLREPLTSTASFSLPESEIYFYWIMKSADAAEIYSLVEKLKAAYPKSIHIAGGTHVEHCSKECEKIFDSLCFGTGEELLIEALNDFQNGKLRQLYKTHGVYPFENYSHPLRDFLPDHRIVNKEHFSQYGDFIGTTAYFSRGCSFSCNFCIYNFPRTFDYRKHTQITEEIEYLKERYKIDAINIKDEVCIPPNINLCREYLEAIGKSNIKWRGQTIPAGSEEMIKLARESGCLELALGIESVENDKEQVYRVRVTEKWNQSAWSNVRGASSYQRVVKVDYIRDLGDDITISNMGPSLPFTHVLSNVNAQFPIWIQNGEKVFSLIDGGVGLLVNENGTSLRTISGEKPQDIAFNLDQSMAVFTGTDHNIYIVNLNEDESPVKLTNETNNEWYGDPEFIEGSNLILYWQQIHQSNNNIGVKDIFTMDLDGKNVKQITNAQNIEKFILPRMSPDRAKILYALEGDGLYIMNYPGETVGVAVTKVDGQKIMPVTSQYFRNIRWSYDSQKAILWSFESSSYFIYLFTLNANPPLTLLQSGGRYADWINDTNADTIIFRSESSDAIFIKDVSESSSKEPTLLYNAPWAQLQPRQ